MDFATEPLAKWSAKSHRPADPQYKRLIQQQRDVEPIADIVIPYRLRWDLWYDLASGTGPRPRQNTVGRVEKVDALLA